MPCRRKAGTSPGPDSTAAPRRTSADGQHIATNMSMHRPEEPEEESEERGGGEEEPEEPEEPEEECDEGVVLGPEGAASPLPRRPPWPVTPTPAPALLRRGAREMATCPPLRRPAARMSAAWSSSVGCAAPRTPMIPPSYAGFDGVGFG